MEILMDETNSEVISWLPHGTGFQIHKKKTFAAGKFFFTHTHTHAPPSRPFLLFISSSSFST
jgi:hypothetical protein